MFALGNTRRTIQRAAMCRAAALAAAFALLASSSAAVVHTHFHADGAGPPALNAVPPAPSDLDSAHAIGPCAMCATGARDEVAPAARSELAPPAESLRALSNAAPEANAARWFHCASPPRAPPIV